MRKNKLILRSSLVVALFACFAAGALNKTAQKTLATDFESKTTTITDFSFAKINDSRQRLIASLSVADWGSTPVEKDITNSKVSEYNYHTNVSINGTTITDFTGWNSRCIFAAGGSQIPKLYFDVSHGNFVAGDVVTFNEGTQFPSYDYVVNGGKAVCFTLENAISFSYSGSQWSVVVPTEERPTEIASVKFKTGSDVNHYCYMMIKLTKYDYTGGEMEDPNWTKMTSFNINGIKLNGENIVFDSARKNRYRAANSTVMLYVYSADGTGSEYTSVVIPQGTTFPSKANHDSDEKSVYIIKKNTVLYPSAAGFVEGTSADMISVSRVNETRLRLGVSLTNFDHEPFTADGQKDNYPTDYAVFNNILIDGASMTRWPGMSDSRCYSFKTIAGWGFDFKFGENAVPKTIVIKQGTLFASYSYLEGGVEKYFVVTEDVTFKHDNSEYFVYGCVNTLNKFSNTYLKMDSVPTTDMGTGLCITEGWYTAAKEAYTALRDKDKSLFIASSDYSNARMRFIAWANANGEDFNNGSFSNSTKLDMVQSDEMLTNTIIIVASVSLLSLFVSMALLRKKKRI